MRIHHRQTAWAKLILVAALGGCGGKVLEQREVGELRCRLSSDRRTIDLTCDASATVQLTSINWVFWVAGGSDSNELLTAPVTITPQQAYQRSVLTPTNGKIRLDAHGACTHGFQLTFTNGGEQKKLAFTPLHIDCDERG